MTKEARRSLSVGKFNNLCSKLEVKVGEEPPLVVTQEEAAELAKMLAAMAEARPQDVDGY
jgi:hypothetical protein